MNATYLDIKERTQKILDEGKDIPAAVEKEKKENVTTWETSKARTQLFVKLGNHVKELAAVFTQETEVAIREISELTASSTKTIKECEVAVSELQQTWDEQKAQLVIKRLTPVLDVPTLAGNMKADLTKHQPFRGGFPLLSEVKRVLGDDFGTRLDEQFLTLRAKPMADMMLAKGKYEKTDEYKKRAELLIAAVKVARKDGDSKGNTMELLTKNMETVDKNKTDLKELVRITTEKCTRGAEALKKDSSTAGPALTAVVGTENNLKTARAMMKTVKFINDNFLKNAGALAGSPGTKKMAEGVKKDLAEVEKMIEKLTKSVTDYRKAHTTAVEKEKEKEKKKK